MNYNETLLIAPFVKDMRTTLPRNPGMTWSRRDPSKIRGVVYHQSLGSANAKDIARYHTGPNHIAGGGLPSIAYTFFVERDGRALLCNDVEDVTWSQGDASKPGDENVRYISVCFGGDFTGPGHVGNDNLTTEQLTTAGLLWMLLRDLFELSNDQLFGHYDFGKPACPGTDLATFIAIVNEDVEFDNDESLAVTQQRLLTTLGYYDGAIDGIWGPRSKSALLAFQRDHGLTPDGVWGVRTNQAVEETIHADPA